MLQTLRTHLQAGIRLEIAGPLYCAPTGLVSGFNQAQTVSCCAAPTRGLCAHEGGAASARKSIVVVHQAAGSLYEQQ